jgi:uncharacterized membrane protein
VKHPLKPMNAKVLLVGESWVSSSKAKEGSEILAMLNDHPLLVVGTFGDGRTVAWTSDIGPHWCPREFVDWFGYGEIWARIIRWLCKENE